jgi:hypothetical protein
LSFSWLTRRSNRTATRLLLLTFTRISSPKNSDFVGQERLPLSTKQAAIFGPLWRTSRNSHVHALSAVVRAPESAYAPKLEILERDVLPRFPNELTAEAMRLMSGLAPLPPIE